VRVWNKGEIVTLPSGQPATVNGETARLSIDGGAPPFAGWIGRVLSDGVLALDPKKVHEQLKECGFEPEAVIDEWAEVGAIRKGADGKRSVVCRLSGKQARFYVFPNMDGWIGKDVTEDTPAEAKPVPVKKLNPYTFEEELPEGES
jgi:hypothetical protein